MASAKTERDHCVDNNTIYKIGEKWSDYGVCNLKVCEPGGHISEKLCPPQDLSTGCSRIEGDLNQPFPQCCPTMDCTWEEPSTESSSSSSSDEDEEDLFDDDGEGMMEFIMEDSTPVSSEKAREESETITDKGIAEINNSDNLHISMQAASTLQVPESNDVTNTSNVIRGNESSPDAIKGTENTLNDVISFPSHSSIKESHYTKEEFKENDKKVQENVIHKESIDNVAEEKRNKYEITSEYETAVDHLRSMREHVNKDVESSDSVQITRNNSQESMDSINYSNLVDVKEERESHTLQAMNEDEEDDAIKLTGYTEGVDKNFTPKELIDSQVSTEDTILQEDVTSDIYKDDIGLSKTSKETILHDESYFDITKNINTDIEYLSEKHHNIFKQEEDINGENISNTQALYKSDFTQGVIYNPDDAEGFLKKPEENVTMESTTNEFIVESSPNHEHNDVNSINHQPNLTEITDIDAEMHQGKEIYVLNTEDIFTGNTDLYDEHDTETAVLADENIELHNESHTVQAATGMEEHEVTVDLATNDDHAESLTVLNTDGISAVNEENIDSEQFGNNENNNYEQINSGIEESSGTQQDIPYTPEDDEEQMSGNIVQETGDSTETTESYYAIQANVSSEQDFQESIPNEEQTQYASQMDDNESSSNNEAAAVGTSTDDTEEMQDMQ